MKYRKGKNWKNVFLCQLANPASVSLDQKKGNKNRLLEKLNNFDNNLGFTIENMANNKLNFLDTTVILDNNQLNLEHFRKPTATDCMTNYKTAVSPKS